MASGENLFTDYLVLHPSEAGYLDLLRIFYSSDLEKRDFFDTPVEDRLRGLRGRWLIFVSVVMQKVFFRLKNPMAKIGSNVENWMNYPTCNGGYGRLFWNIFTGNVVRPDSSSAVYTSMIGSLDTRVDLDSNNRVNDERYGPALSVMAAKIAYENEAFVKTAVNDHWQMEFLGFFNFWNEYEEQHSTQVIMFQDKKVDPDLIMVAFRGTSPFDADDWITDLNLSWYELEGVGRLHAGFQKALGLHKDKGWPKEIETASGTKQFAYYTIREKLREILSQNKNAKFMVTGHSLGGALAILFPAILSLHEEKWLLDRMEGVYTFGQPRVGDEKFGEFMKEKLKRYNVKYCRYVYANDVVPRLPYDDKTLMFKHFGHCLYFNSLYQGQVLEEEPNKNYFSVLYVLPKVLNSVFELTRSFILPLARGKEYREGLPEIMFRMVGLVIPGLSNHGPQDYVNLTRLGYFLPESTEMQGSKLD
ncbi:OLC1v1016774C1 [Oldenlandia corymbosa var. corymbosa]|uniref:OLC1v1016774C1 n=1 Tax=Oldenlandia corymbosa var. corymbosa TaxID=529605 RepID=A0AAV1E7Z3_OLDCO|nr:OLC1v1016774C1 [Oldenlandia corymbosa var. corymbosa]